MNFPQDIIDPLSSESSEYILKSLHKTYLEQEKLYPYQENIFQNQTHLDSLPRAILYDWLFDVADDHCLLKQTVYRAIWIADRYTSQTKQIPISYYQLLGAVSMYLAAKLEEESRPMLSLYVQSTNFSFSVHQFKIMEMRICKALNFDFGPPTADQYFLLYCTILTNHFPSALQAAREIKVDSLLSPQKTDQSTNEISSLTSSPKTPKKNRLVSLTDWDPSSRPLSAPPSLPLLPVPFYLRGMALLDTTTLDTEIFLSTSPSLLAAGAIAFFLPNYSQDCTGYPLEKLQYILDYFVKIFPLVSVLKTSRYIPSRNKILQNLDEELFLSIHDKTLLEKIKKKILEDKLNKSLGLVAKIPRCVSSPRPISSPNRVPARSVYKNRNLSKNRIVGITGSGNFKSVRSPLKTIQSQRKVRPMRPQNTTSPPKKKTMDSNL